MLKRQSDFPYFFRKKSEELFHLQKNKIFLSNSLLNVNIVMKFLTSFTIILTLPTMVASFYGMNVPIPFQDYPYAFFVAIIISFILSSITAIIFWKKRFF